MVDPRTVRPLVVGVALILGAVVPAGACLEVDTPPSAVVRFVGPGVAEITIVGFVVQAGGLTAGTDECAVGLGHSGTLFTSITAVNAVDDDDPPNPVPGLAFAANGTTTADLAALVPTTTWQGFHGTVGTSLPGGTVVNLAFTVTVPGPTTYLDIENELAADGFAASDDATSGGNLAGTSQEVEPISAVTEAPDCFNDVLDSTEVCDGASGLGCLPNEVCYDCALCAVPNLPNRCKSGTIKSVSLNVKSKLKCYANTAKLGQPVVPACLTSAQPILMIYWFKLDATYQGGSCPLFPSYPTSATVDTLVDTFDADLATSMPLGTTAGAWQCAAKKFKAASVRQLNTIKCHERAIRLNVAVDPLCISKAQLKFAGAFTRAENPGQCDAGNTGNATLVANRVDLFVSDLLNAIPPP